MLAGPAASVGEAQYFGQNKVQYRTFDFQVLHTAHFDIYYYERERPGVELAARMAERWNARLSKYFGYELSSRQPLILYASSTDFQQTNVVGGTLGEGTGGVTESLRRRIVLPFAGPLADTDHVIGHELVHAFQYDIANQRSQGNRRVAGVGVLPLWFIEGMAEYLSIGARSPLTSMWLRDAVAREELPSIEDLANPRYFPYRWGHALWAYIGGRWGDDAIARILDRAIDSGSYEDAFQSVLGLSAEDLSTEWQEALREAYGPIASRTQPPSAFGRALTPDQSKLGGELNVSPSLSPDGRRVAFLSERGLFSIDLYIAEVESGQTTERLTRTAVDPHFQSLQFITSAGTWDPSGAQFAIATVVDGDPTLTIYDVNRGRPVREIRLEGLDGAVNPSWSRDGARIALVGLSGGLTDLYTVDLSSGALTRLTNDPYAELQPAWSPDGRQLAFSTDRFTTSLEDLSMGSLQLAVIDVESRSVRPISVFETGKQIGAQWDDAGRALYVVADPDGISNVYRVDLENQTATRLTAVTSGVSGITESSPALSAAGNRLVFGAFENGAYRLYAIDDARGASSIETTEAREDAAQLPPVAAGRSVTALLASATFGLPEKTAANASEPYRPHLSVDYIGQPTIAVGADRLGTFAGGGISLVMSDMLRDHNLAMAFQTSASFDRDFSANDLGGAVLYLNQRHRWNWGVAVDQTPYRSGFFSEGVGTVDGTPALVQQTVISRQTDRGLTGITAYPLNRAERLEFSGGFRQLHFDDFVRTTAFSLITGEVIRDDRQDLSDFPTLNLGQFSAAFVHDTSSFGATSPVLGQRYRLEVSPLVGSLHYTGLLADYRRYFMPVQLYTIAARVLHSGRYGSDADDPRLFPMFLGYPSLVRGYDVGTFEPDECGAVEDDACPAFDRLLGSRMLVANLELRFPLLRPFGLTDRVYGPVPVEVALFADAGVAWTGDDKPEIFGGDRQAVSSAGAAFRVNAFGYSVLQFSFAKPFQRPGRGWIFQFSLAPGF